MAQPCWRRTDTCLLMRFPLFREPTLILNFVFLFFVPAEMSSLLGASLETHRSCSSPGFVVLRINGCNGCNLMPTNPVMQRKAGHVATLQVGDLPASTGGAVVNFPSHEEL